MRTATSLLKVVPPTASRSQHCLSLLLTMSPHPFLLLARLWSPKLELDGLYRLYRPGHSSTGTVQ